MFVYCGNNPVCRIDSSGCAWVRLAFLSWFVGLIKELEASRVYEYIRDQDAKDIGNLRLGVTTVSHGGCGVVATYNALITLGDAKSFKSVLKYYNGAADRLVFNGLLGTLPNMVAEYFESEGYTVVVTADPDEIDLRSKSADACILWYAFPASYLGVDAFGAHFVHYHKRGNGYIAYNVGASGTETFMFPSDYGERDDRYCAIGIFIYI